MNLTSYEKGRIQERRELIRTLIEERFGPLPAPAQERLEQLPYEQLAQLARALMRAESLQELGLEE